MNRIAGAVSSFALSLGALLYPIRAMSEARLAVQSVSPADAAIDIRAIGLTPGTLATVIATTRDASGNRWQSRVMCKADASGAISLARCQPVIDAPQPDIHAPASTYSGVDAMGLFWSMQQIDGTPTLFEFPSSSSAVYEIALAVGGRSIRRIAIERELVADGITRVDLTEHADGIAGVAFEPLPATNLPGRPASRPERRQNAPHRDVKHPAIILVGGSGGGHQLDYLAELLASHGYETLSLAYYNEPDLPDELVNIPLETMGRAIKWLSNRPNVDAKRIGVVGHSRGSEFALLNAADYPRIKAVVALAGSPVGWPGFNPHDYAHEVPAWTFRNRPVPFLPSQDYFAQAYREHRPPITAFQQALKNAAAVDSARIPIDHIDGPVLFLGGEQDTIWPTSRFAKMGMGYLRARHHPYADTMEIYPDAGHWFFDPYAPVEHRVDWPVTGPVGSEVVHFGGTIEGDAHAAPLAWSKMLAFLHAALSDPAR